MDKMKLFYRISLLLVVCCSFAFYTNAQTGAGKIVGIVNSNSGMQPLNAASVTISQKNKVVDRAITDSTGKFSFDHLAPGSYDLSISEVGYQTQPLALRDSGCLWLM